MTEYVSPVVDGEAVERTWTTIAADQDGVVDVDAIGRRRQERERRFSFHADAQRWLLEQELAGWTCDGDGPHPIACRYHGESDSPSNAWVARVYRELPRAVVRS